jgi:hypothetical protein
MKKILFPVYKKEPKRIDKTEVTKLEIEEQRPI